MGKGVIVLDNIPAICAECNFASLKHNQKYTWCDVKQRMCYSAKPDWCPIRKIPEELESDSRNAHEDFDYVCGWNDCLEKVLKGEME